jgi:hypothetical protein
LRIFNFNLREFCSFGQYVLKYLLKKNGNILSNNWEAKGRK